MSAARRWSNSWRRRKPLPTSGVRTLYSLLPQRRRRGVTPHPAGPSPAAGWTPQSCAAPPTSLAPWTTPHGSGTGHCGRGPASCPTPQAPDRASPAGSKLRTSAASASACTTAARVPAPGAGVPPPDTDATTFPSLRPPDACARALTPTCHICPCSGRQRSRLVHCDERERGETMPLMKG